MSKIHQQESLRNRKILFRIRTLRSKCHSETSLVLPSNVSAELKYVDSWEVYECQCFCLETFPYLPATFVPKTSERAFCIFGLYVNWIQLFLYMFFDLALYFKTNTAENGFFSLLHSQKKFNWIVHCFFFSGIATNQARPKIVHLYSALLTCVVCLQAWRN